MNIGTSNLRPLFEATPAELVALLETVQDDMELSDIARCVVLDDDIREAARTVLGRRRRRILPGHVRHEECQNGTHRDKMAGQNGMPGQSTAPKR